MAMPLFISSSSNNQKQFGFTISSNNYRNTSLSPFPSFINGGGAEPVINNGVSSNNFIQLHSSKFLSVVPSFNGSYQQVMNGDSVNHSNQPNRSFDGGDQQVINGVSLNYSDCIYRGLTLVPSFNDYERVMNNGISSNYSSNQQELGFSVSSSIHRNRSLSLVPSLNGHEPVMNNGFSVSSSNHINRSLSLIPSFNGHEPVMNNSFSVSSSNHINRSLSLIPSFNGHEPVMNTGFSVSSSNHINRSSLVPSFNGHERVMNSGFSVSSSNHINRSSLVPSFNGHEQVMNTGFSVSSSNHINRSSLVPSFNGHEQVMNTGFSVSSSKHINRSLSLVPSFNGHEPVMNNGISLNYSDRLQLGFSVSSRNNHENRSLSLEPSSFKIRGQPVNMIVRRRSFVRNCHFSYSSARLQATREILRARLISIFSTRSGHGSSSQINLNNSQQRRGRLTIRELDEEANSNNNNQARSNYSGAITLAPTPVSVYHPPATNNENDDDGITHSLPHQKHGPYTCPRCFGKFPTSQKFAAHVSSHYKHETKSQRRRRLMAKIRRRNLRLHHSREGITLLPTEPVAQPEPTNMAEAEADGDGGALSIVQIKEEPADF